MLSRIKLCSGSERSLTFKRSGTRVADRDPRHADLSQAQQGSCAADAPVGLPTRGCLQSRSPWTGKLPAVFSFLHLHALSERCVCSIYVLEQMIFLELLYKSSSLGALCNPLLLRMPSEWSAGGKGNREGKQAGMLNTLESI